MTTTVGFLSLPTELICHILILLNPRDISRCAMTCNIFWLAVRNSVYIQYKLEIYAQGLISTGTAAMDSTGVSSKTLCSLKKLATLWRSDFHATTTFETVVTAAATWGRMLPIQDVKCGLWWTRSLDEHKFYIQSCGTNLTLSRTWSIGDGVQGFLTTFDPLQDLMVVCSEHHHYVAVTDAEQDYPVCRVEFRLASSQRPHPSAECTSLECNHTFDALPGYHHTALSPPVICGDHVFILYYIEVISCCDSEPVPGMFIQVINWRKGYVNRHFLCHLDFCKLDLLYPVDEQKFVIIGPKSIYLYTLQGLDGPPQCRIIYHLPKILHLSLHNSCIRVHGHPSLHGKAARPGLMPSYVPSLESQIMVLESPSKAGKAILVIDMAIFSDTALRSDLLVKIPWSDWGPQYASYFPHHKSYHISVFGSKMAYALPRDHIPNPGQRLQRLSRKGYFYVHIWDFNKRVVAHSESVNDPDSPDLRICKSGQMIDSFGKDMFSNRAYIATVCRTPFPTAGSRIFLEQDRLTVTWTRHRDISIQVISPIQTDVGLEITE